MDFRFFALGNLLAVAVGMATKAQGRAMFVLLEAHREELLGIVPMKLVEPRSRRTVGVAQSESRR